MVTGLSLRAVDETRSRAAIIEGHLRDLGRGVAAAVADTAGPVERIELPNQAGAHAGTEPST